MEPWAIAVSSLVALLAAIVGVVTGGNSLVTVPVLITLGMEPRRAVATNMLAITFLALSGAVRFARAGRVRWDITLPLVAVTLVTSYLGASLLAALPEKAVRAAIGFSMAAMVILLLARPGFGEQAPAPPSRLRFSIGIAVAALLGVYGGFYSGGYTTLLTFTTVGLLGATLAEAVGLTKVVNFASSGIATVAFARAGLVDLEVGVPMSAAMIVGAWLGASLAARRGYRYMRAAFIVTVALLAAKVVFDLAFG